LGGGRGATIIVTEEVKRVYSLSLRADTCRVKERMAVVGGVLVLWVAAERKRTNHMIAYVYVIRHRQTVRKLGIFRAG